METPRQLAYGLGSLLIAVFLMAILSDLTLSAVKRHPGVKDYVLPVGIGVFVALWWASYLALVRWMGRRRAGGQPWSSA